MKRQHPLNKILFLVLILFSGAAFEAEAGRPLNTDDAGTVSPGVLEIETAYEYVDDTDNENNVSVVLTTGLLGSLDLGVEVPYQFIDLEDMENQNGLSDISVTTKWNAFSKDDLFDGTLSFNYKSDNGNDEKSLGTGEPEFTILAILSKEFTDMALHFNLGPTIVKDDKDLLNYNMAAEWSAADRLTLVGEVFGSNNFQGNFDDNAFSGLLGFALELNENAVYDAGVTIGISDAEPDLKFTTGLTIAFP